MGGYNTSNGFHAGIISYQFGLRINFRGHGKMTPFAHVLFGGARSVDTSPQNAFAMTAGGGVYFNISEHFAIRPIQAEYFLTKFMDGASNRQNNFGTAPESFSGSAANYRCRKVKLTAVRLA